MHPLQQAMSPPYRLDGLLVIRDVVYHCQARVLAWSAKGVIYGRQGQPTGYVCADGYVRLGGNQSRHQYAHRIVWEAVNGPIPPGMQIDHKNGDRADNRIRNLDLVTRQENVLRAMDRCFERSGLPHPGARLNADLVCQIRSSELATRHWARELEMDAKTVRNARRGTTWRHVVCRGAKAVQGRGSRRRTRRNGEKGGAA